MEDLLLIFLLLAASYVVNVFWDWLDDFDNIFANTLRYILLFIAAIIAIPIIGYVIYALVVGLLNGDGAGCWQFYGTSCLDEGY